MELVKRIALLIFGFLSGLLGILSIIVSIVMMTVSVSDINDPAGHIYMTVCKFIIGKLLLAFGIAASLLGLRWLLRPQKMDCHNHQLHVEKSSINSLDLWLPDDRNYCSSLADKALFLLLVTKKSFIWFRHSLVGRSLTHAALNHQSSNPLINTLTLLLINASALHEPRPKKSNSKKGNFFYELCWGLLNAQNVSH